MSDVSGVPDAEREPLWRTLLPLMAITGLALLLRLYRLEAQSAWIDEYQISGGINAPDFRTYVEIGRFRGKDFVPLYFMLLHYWHWLFGGASLCLLRLPSLLSNVACVPLLYVLTRRVFCNRAAILAALCLALSPTQIWHAQSLHVYAFLGLPILISTWGLFNAVRTRRRSWWALLSAANLVAVWTHPFGVFFVCAECLYILWQLRADARRAIALTALQMAICFSIYAWLYPALRDVAKPEEDLAYQLPSLKAVLADGVADDAVMTADPFSFQGTTWPFLPKGVQDAIVGAHGWVDWVMIVFLGACAAWCAYVVVRALCDKGVRNRRLPAPESAPGGVLLLLVAFMPLIILLTLSVLWRPMILPRYTSYSALALYAVVGGGIAFIRNGALRKGAVVLLLVLYGYQLSLSLPAATRTDYRSVAKHIAANAKPSDTVLAAGMFLSWEAFRFNAEPAPYPIMPAYSLTAVCDKATRLLRGGAGAARDKTVWAVLEPFVFTLPPLEQFEQRLTMEGLQWKRLDFPGMNKLYLYRITAAAGNGGETIHALPALASKTDYPRILRDLGCDPADRAAYDAACGALREAWDVEFVGTTLYYSLLSMHLASEGYLELALRAADHAVALENGFAFAHFARAVVLGEMGEAKASEEAFDRAVAVDWVGYARLYEPLFKSLYWEPASSEARARLEALDRLHAYLPFVCYMSAGVAPAAAPLRLGR